MSRGRLIVLAVVVCAALWVALFDSHSLVRRAMWHSELEEVASENSRLKSDIARLEKQVTTVDSDAVVERVAREQYGMRKPGETVYRVEER